MSRISIGILHLIFTRFSRGIDLIQNALKIRLFLKLAQQNSKNSKLCYKQRFEGYESGLANSGKLIYFVTPHQFT